MNRFLSKAQASYAAQPASDLTNIGYHEASKQHTDIKMWSSILKPITRIHGVLFGSLKPSDNYMSQRP
jgi:hypothetical protein